MPNNSAADWDDTSPLLTDPRKAGAAEIRYLREGVATRLAKEHVEPASGGDGGEHLEGSARIYIATSAPTTKPDGVTALDTDDEGRLWFDSDDGVLKYWDGNSWEVVVEAAPTLEYFSKDSDGTTADTTFPYTQSGLTNGTWVINIYGTLDGDLDNGSAYTASVTINGTTKQLYIANHPDGSAPFCIPVVVTVSAGTASITAVSNISRIQGMVGTLVAAS